MSAAGRAGVGIWLGLVMFTGCTSGNDARRTPALDEATARRLVGAWDATFSLDRSMTVTGDSARPTSIAGVLAFVEERRGQLAVPQLRDATHEVAYDVDFRPFGFDLRDRGTSPVAVARTSGKDSVAIVFGAGESLFHLRVQGVFVGDSVTGLWSAESPRAGAGGRFSMHRRQVGREDSGVIRARRPPPGA